MNTDIVEKYWGFGLATLPTKENKSPIGKWKEGINDLPHYINAHGIGIICGQISGGLECLDFDNHFGDAKQTMAAFMQQISDLHAKYKFVIQKTQSDGYHLLYKCEKIEGNLKLASRLITVNNEQRPDAIIETRGEGGYFVADPTPGYRLIRNDFESIPTIPIDVRRQIMSVARSFNEYFDFKGNEYESDERPGDLFNNDISSTEEAKSSLRKSGWVEVGEMKWRRPNKKDGVSATFGKVAKNVFYCFTSNGSPFEPNKGYSPFQIIGLLDYNGDFNSFAKHLSERYGSPIKKQAKEKRKTKEPDQLDLILRNAAIDFKKPVEMPPIAVKIRDYEGVKVVDRRLFTLGNFSAITGKSKSKKTFLTTMILAACVKNGLIDDKFIGSLPDGKSNVILFDTEQSNYDAWITANRVNRLIGKEGVNFMAFDLREYSPMERCDIIDYALGKYHNKTGFVVIDGIADLANANNDEGEGTRVTSLLMKWTKVYNLHICNVIHQNKNDSFATGHLGSYLMKKSECIISVEKVRDNTSASDVKCDMIRGVQDFSPFTIFISEDGLPFLTEMSKEPRIAEYATQDDSDPPF